MSVNNKHVNPPWAGFSQQATEFALQPLEGVINRDVTASVTNRMLGIARCGGRIEDIVIGLAAGGVDNESAISLEVDIKIDGTSCCTTKPKISYVSGELDKAITTNESGEGIIETIIDHDNKEFTDGSVFTYDATVVKTTPDTEMSGLGIMVKLEPLI